MSVETAVRGLLTSSVPVTAVLSGRIHPAQAPQSSVYPCLVYTDASRKNAFTYDGPTPTDSYGMTLETYGRSYSSTKAAARAVRDRLLGYKGDVDGGRILGIFDEDEGDSVDQPLFDEERGIFFVTLNLTVWYQSA